MEAQNHHDHGMDPTNGDSKSCPMIMSFHGGYCEQILWKGWVANTLTEFILSAFAIGLIAFAYEAIKFVREYFLRKTIRKEAQRVAQEMRMKGHNTNSNGSGDGCCSNAPLAVGESQTTKYTQKITNRTHLAQTGLNLIQIIVSYLLMLVIMTFNYWLCLAVILGLGLGYFFFGWIRPDVYATECCH